MSGDRYVVEIKSSARRANGMVGRVVNSRGVHHRFESREHAETWAAGLSSQGARPVWIRRANPNDPSPVDAYLMSRRPADESEPWGGNGTPGTGDRVAEGGLARDWEAVDHRTDDDGDPPEGQAVIGEYDGTGENGTDHRGDDGTDD